LNYHWNPYCI